MLPLKRFSCQGNDVAVCIEWHVINKTTLAVWLTTTHPTSHCKNKNQNISKYGGLLLSCDSHIGSQLLSLKYYLRFSFDSFSCVEVAWLRCYSNLASLAWNSFLLRRTVAGLPTISKIQTQNPKSKIRISNIRILNFSYSCISNCINNCMSSYMSSDMNSCMSRNKTLFSVIQFRSQCHQYHDSK